MDDKNRSFSTDNTDDDDYVDMVLDDGTELHCSCLLYTSDAADEL